MKRLLSRTAFGFRARSLSAALAIVTFYSILATEASPQAEPEYLADVWGTEQGLPSATISGIAQTPDGYLWCGTYDGVVRFDGVRFLRIGPDDSTNQEANRIQCLLVDRRGQLWIGTDGAGLLRYANGTFTTFGERAGSTLNAIRSIAEDATGDLWLGTRGGIGRFRNGKVDWFTEPRGTTNASRSVWNIAFDPNGALWVADWLSLKRFENGKFEPADLQPEVHVPLRAIYCDQSGKMWAGMLGHALHRDKDNTWKAVANEGVFANTEVTTFCKTRSGEFWAGTRRGLCRVGRDGKWRTFNLRDRAINSDVRVLFEDREGNLWIGTGSSGLVRLKRRIVRTYATEHGLGEGPVFGICEKPEGGLWLGLNNGQVVQSSGERFDQFQRLSGIPSDAPVKSVIHTRDGALWIGTFGNGLFRVKDGALTRFKPSVGSPARIDRVTALLEDDSGAVWIGSYYSLYRGDTITNVVVPVTVAGREMRAPVVALLKDRAGALWVGWEGFGISRLARDDASWITRREGLPTHFVRAFHEDRSGVIWIGTTAGLSFWRDGKLYTVTRAQGLIDDSILQILEDDSDNLWLGTTRGLMRAARQNLLAVGEGKKGSLELFACGAGEGMLSEQCSGGSSPAAARTKSGKLCFPTARGLVVVDPLHLKLVMDTNPPPVYIEEIRADGKVVAQPSATPARVPSRSAATVPLVLGAETRRLEFDFTAPSLTAPERVRFKYRLEGYDPDWTEPGMGRSAVYPNVTPGRYQFQVLACNADGVWNETGHSFSFRVAAPFWRTWWFLAVATIASAGLVGGGVRVVAVRNLRRRLRRLEEAHAIEKERMRIAQDMHDEIGGKLSRISFLSDMAIHNVPQNSKAGRQIEEVSEAAREVIRTVDEIVWAVSPRNDTLESVVHYICRHAEEFFELTSVELELELPRDFPASRLSAEVRHNLFCAVKESLNNVLKHAGATRVRIVFGVLPGAFVITVTDDGHGFDANATGNGTGATNTRVGNGLLNMRERLQSVHGTFRIESRDGSGTRVVFELPLN